MKTLSICIVLAGGLWVASLPAAQSQPVAASMEGAEAAGACVLSPPGLIAWWRGESNALDSIDSYNGTAFNNVGFAPAEVGTGFAFRGGTDYVGLPQNLFPVPTSGTGTTPFSFELWFSTTAGGVILGQQNTTPFDGNLNSYVPALYVGSDGKLRAALFWNTFKQLVSPRAVNDGVFHHAAITYDGTIEVLYLDGAIVGSTNFVQQAYASSYQYQLGTGFTGGWPATSGGWDSFNGRVDEVSLYNRALSASEVAAIVNAGSAGKCAGTPPQILTQPSDQFVALGANATFAVVATGTAPLRYQWQFNGQNLAESTHYVGAYSNILTIVGVVPFDAGSYRVVITNAFGATNSAVVNLAASPACVPPPPGLTGWWRGENNALDSADAHSGTLMNGVGFALGKVGCAFAFRGSTDYVGLPQNLFPMPTSGTGTTPFSFELWFSTTAGGVILGQQNTTPFDGN
ncbi:MAG TPA: LamG-like jellyroll fold domain-containing protein, partial [Candidatus Sulfotelmatobacter sp.]|nr:LamG-like jellyroll fold domain-containing protein [Candidatus Sulfotelmatobacter sp.]